MNGLLTELKRLGIRISLNENKLRLEAPPGVLTPELKETIAGHKQELIAYLRRPTDSTWRLYPLLGRRVKTRSGIEGRLLQVFHDRVTIHPPGAAKVTFVRPEEVIIPPGDDPDG